MVFFQNPRLINIDGWGEVCNQFQFAFPVESDKIENMRYKSEMEKITFFEELIHDYQTKDL